MQNPNTQAGRAGAQEKKTAALFRGAMSPTNQICRIDIANETKRFPGWGRRRSTPPTSDIAMNVISPNHI